MIKTLNEFIIGETGHVKKVNSEGRIRQRLFDMGITPGAVIMFKKASPFGDPIEVAVRGYSLALRRNEAKCILMEVSNND